MRKPQQTDPSALSRRALLGVTAAVPAVGGNASIPCSSDDTVAQCAAWVELDLEIDRLALRWAKLETRMTRDHGWLNLSHVKRRALPGAGEMFEIDDKLEALSDQRELMLRTLSRLPANTLHAVASKLVIAARLMQHEDGPAQPFVVGVVRELAQMRCPSCGAAYVPGGAAQRA